MTATYRDIPAECVRVISTRSMAGVAKAIETVPEAIREDVRRNVRMQVGMFRHSDFRLGWCPSEVRPEDFWNERD